MWSVEKIRILIFKLFTFFNQKIKCKHSFLGLGTFMGNGQFSGILQGHMDTFH